MAGHLGRSLLRRSPSRSSPDQRAQDLREAVRSKEWNPGTALLEITDTRKADASILDANTPPDVRGLRRRFQLCPKEFTKTSGPLGEHLVGVPVSPQHHERNSLDVFVGNFLVKKVAHRVDEDHSGLLPPDWLQQFFRHKPQIKALFVRMPRHASEPLREDLGVAVSAPGTDLGAASNWVPGCVSPLDL